MLFTSDNWSGVHPKIMDAMVAANGGHQPAYGADDVSKSLVANLEDVFGQEVGFSSVATGSAANALALSCLVPPYGGILAHGHGHVHVDECGAPEFYTGGAKMVSLSGEGGKLTPNAVEDAMRFYTPVQTHHIVPKVLSLTQGTEYGTVYSQDELAALVETARRFDLYVHLDGARLSNACAFTDETFRAYTTDIGIDVLTLGGTKNGCMVADAIIFFNREVAESLPWRVKRAGQSFSKYRFISAQWNAYLQDDLWREMASHANLMAQKLSQILENDPRCDVIFPTQINEVFATIPDDLVTALKDRGAAFYDWVQPGDAYNGTLRRLVTNFETQPSEVKAFEAALASIP